jgi:release factor glutamine methyltransferase
VTVREAIARGARLLDEAGVPNPAWDAELLLRHVLGWSRADVVADEGESLDPSQVERLEGLLRMRAGRRPLQYLTGTQAFWRHDLVVTPDVLIPRPETELLVETVLQLHAREAAPLIMDVGTGSGCIALALAAELPRARILATDVSAAAVAVADANLRRYGLRHRVTLVVADLLGPFRRLERRVDVIACNPPYVAREGAAVLMPEVRDHEPSLALFPPGPADSIYRRLIGEASLLLAPQGAVVVELGLGLEGPVRAICEENGLVVTDVRLDLQGWARTLTARSPARVDQ